MADSTHVLIVEPDQAVKWRLQRACEQSAYVTSCDDFSGARAQMLAATPALLVTNLRLNEYNGLHLVLLSQAVRSRPRCLVHTDRPDFLLIKEAQHLGAFFERTDRLPYALPSYIHSRWPSTDSRNPRRVDRRTHFRGGRRASDVQELVASSPS